VSQAFQQCKCGVIHRDLKPHNVMVDHNQKVHLMDFGLARDVNTDSGLTIKGNALGTPNYMSPEQWIAESELTAATDIYAIGAVLYEMVTSIPPFRGSNIHDMMERVKFKPPIAPRLINPSIPRDLNTVCMKCLEKDSARRYLSAGELAEELNRVLRDEPILAKPISGFERGWRWCKRNKALSSVIGGATAIIVIGTLTALVVLNRERIQAENAQKEAEQQRNHATNALAQLQKAQADIVAKNKELQADLDEITHQKGVIASSSKTDAERDLAQAVKLFHDLRLSEAQAAADKIVAAQPNLPEGWYLRGQLALVNESLADAKEDFKKADDLFSGGLDAPGQALLDLATRYAAIAQQAPGGKLAAKDSLNLLHELQGKDEYFAFVEAQRQATDLELQSIRAALGHDNAGQFVDHVSVRQDGEDVILTLKDIPIDLNLTAVKQFPIFTSIHLENTGIKSLAPFQGMQLTRVELIGSPVSSLAELRSMPLRILILKNVPIQDLSPLRDIPLHSLALAGVPVPPSQFLERWPLDDLQISDEPLPDKFAIPKGVRSVSLARTGLVDLQLVAASSLQSLDISGNTNLTSLEPLRGMSTLRQLDISDTGVSSLLPLANLNLESLRMRHTLVSQVACLKDTPLRELDLRGSPIADLDKLIKLPPVFFPPQAH
jgi:hypothetical protein